MDTDKLAKLRALCEEARGYPTIRLEKAVVKAMLDVVEAGRAAVDDWYYDGTCKDLRRALAALADKLK